MQAFDELPSYTIETHDGREIELHGLSHSMNLTFCHDAMATGNIAPTSMGHLKNVTKGAAKIIYNQEKFTEVYHSRVCGAKHTLAWFLCKTHRCSPPQKQSRDGSPSSIKSAKSNSSGGAHDSGHAQADRASRSPVSPHCKISNPGKGCQLPALKNVDLLPASHWDALYYAVAAEIKFLYNDLQERFGKQWERGAHVLHNFGSGEGMKYEVCVAELAAMLERFWIDLMHPFVVCAIDYRVKQQKAFEQLGRVPNMPEILAADGMISIDGATPEQIWHMLKVDFVPKITQAVNDNVKENVRLMSPRSAMRRYAPIVKYGLDPKYLQCSCPSGCECQTICPFHDTGCTCEIARQRLEPGTQRRKAAPPPLPIPRPRLLIAELAAMSQPPAPKVASPLLPIIQDSSISAGTVRARLAAFERPNLQLAIPPHTQVNTITPEDEAEVAEAYRQLALDHPAAAEEPIAHAVPARKPVPFTQQAARPRVEDPKTPVRAPKDANPLGFYADYSGQRYPAEARIRAPTTVSPPAYGATLQPIVVPTAKDLMPAELSPDNAGLFPQPLIIKRNNTATASTRIPFMDNEVAKPRYGEALGRNGYETSATLRALEGMELTAKPSKSATQVTQSFPVPTRGNVRQPDNLSDAFPPPFHAYTTPSPPRYASATQYEPFPRLSTEGTVSPPATRPYTTLLPSLISNSDILAHAQSTTSDFPNILPLRDHITPQPAKPGVTQRYVSAGGMTPLHEREEISAPELDFLRQPALGEASYSKEAVLKAAEQLFAREDKEQVARVRSEESVSGLGRGSGEGVREGRERVSTGSGRVGERLKRMFSRNYSGTE